MPDEYARALLTFLPAYLLRQAAAGVALERWEKRFPAAVLMADISGFTPLAEALARAGRRGAEELSFLLNDHFSRLIDLVRAYGGDVVQFSGDAITALFDLASGEDLAPDVLLASACAMAMQRHIATAAVLPTSQGNFPLQVRIGVGAGQTYAAVVGSRAAGLRHLLAGPARQGAVRAQRLARPGEVVLSRSAYLAVREHGAAVLTRWGYACLQACDEPPAAARDTAATSLPPERMAELAAFLPPALGQRLQVGGRAFIGEHRYVAVLFAGFQGLDFARDPAVGERLRAYVAAVQEVVGRYDGYLAEVEVADKGSLLLVLFGAPAAHGDDDERAVLCALALQELPRRPGLALVDAQRIGISAGPLFVGSVGGEARWTYAAVGDEVNLAARLMERAAWGQVVTSGRIRTHIGDRGHFVPLGSVTLKGKAQSVPAFVAEGVRERPGALAERWLLYQGAIVGREAELDQVQQAGQQVLAGRPQVLVVEGEAGMGKSRLVGEAVRWWLDRGLRGYGGDCFSYTAGTPYQPWSLLLQEAMGLAADQPAAVRARQAEQFLGRIASSLVERLPLLADMLGMAIADNAVTRHLQDAQRKRALFKLVLEIVDTLAAAGPLLLLFEDIHWSDLPSLELIEYVARNLAGRPVWLLLTHRPLDEPLPVPYRRLLGLPFGRRISLSALPAADGQALALARLGLPAGIDLPLEVQLLLNRAQGNPFFIEEILNALADVGVRLLPDDGRCLVQGDLAAVEIPQTVQALVQARLDCLDEGAQLTAKVAAVIGRTVPYTTLRAIHPLALDDRTLRTHLALLERLDLIRLEHRAAEPTFFFKHVITQQVAYESLPFAHRQALHRALGQYLEAAHAADLDEVVDLLAHHYSLGADPAKAFAYLVRAGDRAARAYTNREALEYYRQAREWLAAGDPTQHGELLQRMERALYALGQRDEQRRVQEEMEQLARALGNDRLLAVAFGRRGALLAQTGSPAEGVRVLQEGRALAEAVGDLSLAGYCAVEISHAYWLQGRVGEARQALDQARFLFRRADDRDGEASTLNMEGNIALALLSQYERALHAFRRESEIHEALGNEMRWAVSRLNEAIALLTLGRPVQALEVGEPARAFFERSGDPRLIGVASFMRAHALMRLERYAEALGEARRCIALLEECEEHNFLTEGEGVAGRVLLQMGRLEDALDHFRRAYDLAEAGEQMMDAAHYLSYQAVALLRLGEVRSALHCADRVRALIEHQTCRADNLAAMYFHLFLVLQKARGSDEARPYLERAYRMVQEMADEIVDPGLRRSFLEEVQTNREIVQAWQGETA